MFPLKHCAVLLALSWPLASYAGPRDMPRHMERMAEELRLTPEQKSGIQKIHKDSHDKIKAQKLSLKESKRELDEAMGKPDVKAADLSAIHEKFVLAKSEAMRLRFANLLQIRTLLTPEQLTKFSQAATHKGHKRGPHAGPNSSGPFEDSEDAE